MPHVFIFYQCSQKQEILLHQTQRTSQYPNTSHLFQLYRLDISQSVPGHNTTSGSPPSTLQQNRRILSTIMSTRPDALSSSPLQKFPSEIILCIVDHLPRAAALSFFLSCWNLKVRLGIDRFYKLATSVSISKKRSIAFLKLLAIDFPNAIVCVPCRRLHGWRTYKDMGDSTQTTTGTTLTAIFYLLQRVSLRTVSMTHTLYLAYLAQPLSKWPSNDIRYDPTVRK